MKRSVTTPSIVFFLFYTLILSAAGCNADGEKITENRGNDEAWIGVYAQDLDAELRRYFDLDDKEGVIINQVVDDSPAEKAGFKEEDLIIRFDRKRISDARDLAKTVARMSPGEKTKAEIVRGNKKKTVDITIGSRPQRESFQSGRYNMKPPTPAQPPHNPHSGQAWLGIEMTEMSSDLAEYFDADENDGILILSVSEDSPADRAGMKPGDVLMKIDGDRIRSKEDVVNTLSKLQPGDEIGVEIKRKGRNRSLDATLGSQSGGRYHGFNNRDMHEFQQGMQNWQHEFNQEMSKVLPQLERELQVLKDVEIPIKEIEEQIQRELRAAQEQIERELAGIELELQMEFEESL